MESSNLQMIAEQDGENQLYQTHTQDMEEPVDAIGTVAMKQTDVQRIENGINLIHEKGAPVEMSASMVQYEGDEEDIVCGRFPHLSICACDINSAVALKEINLF